MWLIPHSNSNLCISHWMPPNLKLDWILPNMLINLKHPYRQSHSTQFLCDLNNPEQCFTRRSVHFSLNTVIINFYRYWLNFPVACCKAKEWDKLLILYTKHGDKRLAAGIFWKVNFNKDLFNVGTNGVKDVWIIKFGGKALSLYNNKINHLSRLWGVKVSCWKEIHI